MDNADLMCDRRDMRGSIAIGVAIGLSLVTAFAQFAAAESASFGGVAVTPGATVQANVPLSDTEKSYVSEGGNVVPPHAVAVLAVPPGFTPEKPWPLLVVLSTSDFKRQNRTDLVEFYRESALAEGWLVLAGDGPEPARHDTAGWRAGTTLAALDALHRSFPGSRNWPVACAGFSGGAKRASTVAPLLAVAGCRMSGIYLTGINEERLTESYRKFRPGSAFLRTPIFISSGQTDRVALLRQQQDVKQAIERAGFSRVRMEVFPEGHAVKRAHLRAALRWFREP